MNYSYSMTLNFECTCKYFRYVYFQSTYHFLVLLWLQDLEFELHHRKWWKPVKGECARAFDVYSRELYEGIEKPDFILPCERTHLTQVRACICTNDLDASVARLPTSSVVLIVLCAHSYSGRRTVEDKLFQECNISRAFSNPLLCLASN